jgi:hypothetical protein
MTPVSTADPAAPEERLREALDTLAGQVHPAPDAFRQAQAEWWRRERRRRLILAILIAVVFAIADLIGLWALNQARDGTHIIFNDPAGVQSHDPKPAAPPAVPVGPAGSVGTVHQLGPP